MTGFLLFVCGTGGLVWAEHSIPSGVAALVVATEPMAFVLIEAMRRRRMPRGTVLAGLALGSAGLAILAGPGAPRRRALRPGGAGGARRRDLLLGGRIALLPRLAPAELSGDGDGGDAARAAAALLALVGVAAGELCALRPGGRVARSPSLATLYLFVFGSIVGFSAYVWLLRVTTASRAVDVRLRQPDRRGVPGLGPGGRGALGARASRRRS